MAYFLYTALTQDDQETSSSVEASDRASAIAALRRQNLRLLRLSEAKSTKKTAASFSFLKKRIKSDELVMFTRQLSAMVGAGVPILRALTSMQEHAESPVFKQIIGGVTRDVQGGMPFADALGKHPQAFSDVYVNMVRAGEAAGILDEILRRLAMQQEKNASIKKKIKSAMTYPMVLVGITVVAFFGLMLFVIPMIGKTIKDLAGPDAQLPALTQAMLGISGIFVSFWYIIFPVVGGTIYVVLHYVRTKNGKRRLHQLVLKTPIINRIVTKVAVARFARTFSALIGAGVAILEALDITAHAIGNTVYEESLKRAGERVKNGEVLSQILAEDTHLYPSIVPQMLAVGEETGQTDQVLVKVADFYEEEVDTEISGLSSTIEPVMIVFMGGMVGLIAASVMLPIANLSNQIKS